MSSSRRHRFPTGFVWGAATAAYQIEGAAAADGRGLSVWDVFSHTPGTISDRSTGDVACDHYFRYADDVALMGDLGLNAYRFSVAWPRVIPTGAGAVNQAGLDFYDRLTDELLERGIEPYITLFHWDLPQALQEAGGWVHRDTVKAFVDYADTVTRALGDRVTHWFTHNEPFCVAVLGHEHGVHAPGLRDRRAAVAASHHLLLSHGSAVPVIRSNVPDADVGIVLNLTEVVPASSSDADAAAARLADGVVNRWYLDPIFGRGYPSDVVERWCAEGVLDPASLMLPEDASIIAAPTDVLGVNYYFRSLVRSDAIAEEENDPRERFPQGESERTAMGWEVHPRCLRHLLERLHRDYDAPRLMVTENGAAYDDHLSPDGSVHDVRRVQFFQDHLRACHEAIQAGVRLEGYFAWSLLDNFEWAYGYSKRFGLIHVDYDSQTRRLKDSALWYREVIRQGGISDAKLAEPAKEGV